MKPTELLARIEEIHTGPLGLPVVQHTATGCVVVSLPWDCDESKELSLAGFSPDYCTEGLLLGEQDWCLRPGKEVLPRRFRLERNEDVSGVSGTGHVADGVLFPDGTTVIRWRTKHRSTTVYESLGDCIRIHGHGGATRVGFIDEATR